MHQFLLSIVGKDVEGNAFMQNYKKMIWMHHFVLQSKERITTTKTRVMAKNQQTIRIDNEITTPLSVKEEHHFIDICLRAIQIEKPDILIFERL
ncbi:MAG: hypothetical protein IPO02_15705 [Bacteroidetes bacterium]|nr:hypothetical protein [Bacteroidota bacterium]